MAKYCVWKFPLKLRGEGHNVLGENEYNVSEVDMIDGVLNQEKVSRFRSETNPSRLKNANHFSLTSPSVVEAFANVGGVYLRLK